MHISVCLLLTKEIQVTVAMYMGSELLHSHCMICTPASAHACVFNQVCLLTLPSLYHAPKSLTCFLNCSFSLLATSLDVSAAAVVVFFWLSSSISGSGMSKSMSSGNGLSQPGGSHCVTLLGVKCKAYVCHAHYIILRFLLIQ